MPPAHRSPADDFREAAAYLTRRAEAGAALPPEDARRVTFAIPKLPPPGFWHNHAEPCGVEGCIGGTRVGSHVLMAPAPLPTVRHDPAPTGDAGEPEMARR